MIWACASYPPVCRRNNREVLARYSLPKIGRNQSIVQFIKRNSIAICVHSIVEQTDIDSFTSHLSVYKWQKSGAPTMKMVDQRHMEHMISTKPHRYSFCGFQLRTDARQNIIRQRRRSHHNPLGIKYSSANIIK